MTIPKHLFSPAFAAEAGLLEELLVSFGVVCSLSAEGRLLYVGAAASMAWGYDPAALTGQPLALLLPAADADDFRRLLAEAAEGAAPCLRTVFRLRRANGAAAAVCFHALLIRDGQGRLVRLTGVVQDAGQGDRDPAVPPLPGAWCRLLFYESPTPKLIYASGSLQVMQVNDAAVATYGYSAAEFLQLRLADLLAEAEAAACGAYSQGAEQAFSAGGLTRHRKKSGEEFYVDVNVQVLPPGAHGLVTVFDMTAQLQLQQRLLAEKVASQKAISRVILATQEKERNHLGKELHDNVNQLLTTAKLYVESIKHLPEQSAFFADKGIALLLRAINEIRSLSRQLVAPALEATGLEQALTELVDHYRLLNLFRVDLRYAAGEPEPEQGIQLLLYRVVQEQLNNIVKYAQATEVQIVLLAQDGCLRLQVSDNGVGFDPANTERGLGLRNIESRADAYKGVVRIETAPGKGCTLVVQFAAGEW